MKKLLILAFMLISAFNFAQLKVVSDINKGTSGSNPEDFFEFKGELYFSALITEPYTNNDVIKLWKTDGTEIGTKQLEDIERTRNNYFHYSENYIFYFNGQKFVKTDGTTTQDVNIDLANFQYVVGAYGNYFYFINSIGEERALYKTDGTTTTLLKSFPKSERLSASDNKKNIFKFNDSKIIIYLETETHGREPYITDGTPAETKLLKNITINDSSTENTTFHQVNNFSVFKIGVNHLWKSDGSENGTKKIKEFTFSRTKIIDFITPFNSKLYFSYYKELWETDGTETGTKMVFDEINNEGLIRGISKIGNNLMILTQQAVHLYDGSSNTTTKLNTPDLSLVQTKFISIGNKAYFNADYKGQGFRIWTTDGTEAGTKSLKPVWPDGKVPSTLQKINNKLIFSSGSTQGTYNIGELWVSDGTDTGTKLLKDINKAGNINSSPQFLTKLNGKVYFAADDNINGRELFVFDGTTTTLVKDINPGFQSSKPHDFYLFGDKIIFKAYSLDKGLELWITDGTTAGTKILKDINPNGDGFLNDNRAYVRIGYFKEFNSELYFFANNGTNGMELWKTDGTEAGTTMLKDINSGANSCSRPALDLRPKIVETNNELYFYAAISGSDNNLSSFKMWKTDGTTDGTVLADDINSAVKSNTISGNKSFSFNNHFYFYGREFSTNQLKLFRTDGANTIKFIPNLKIYQTTQFFPNSERIYYVYNENMGAGTELWAIEKDDTVGLFKDIVSGAHSSSPSRFFKINGYLYFQISNADFKGELWRIGDNFQPEVVLSPQNNLGFNGYERLLSNGEDLLIFEADVNVGYKLSQLDLTTKTLTEVFSINNKFIYGQTVGGFNVYHTIINDKLYFTGNIEGKGEELLSIDFKTLSIENLSLNHNSRIIIYPNPVKNDLSIKLKSKIKKGSIFNILGKKILSFSSKKVDVSRINPGIYILKVEDIYGNISSKKWIKK
ncbi:putative secreted protein (Por secretion system target) [Lutibacter sp. Hel_I_33_5]|uniref:T9SS type A sorting domain-containing protein n=1 Tax=Lutibacter sp. Hel_I_33_5 TaxID=1566289 RepID=UPI0011AA9AB1|nr:T9SS type A sorting domain-containing protein [Lutibacter sp. Hel_I_33_5]TVZ55076.1 putative secreted protein (Por secretion system target) [Lutibacter sp. Hel_I_33_5]